MEEEGSRGREGTSERKRKNFFICGFTLQKTVTDRAGTTGTQELGTPPFYPTDFSGSQVCHPSLAAFPRYIIRKLHWKQNSLTLNQHPMWG